MTDYLTRIVARKDAMVCRVPLSKDRLEFVPLVLNFWGTESPLSLLVHFNIVFHSLDGFILGASAYSLHDHGTPLVKFETMPLQANIRWFAGTSFERHFEDDELTWSAYFSRILSFKRHTNHLQTLGVNIPNLFPVHSHFIPRASVLKSSVSFDIFLMYIGIAVLVSASFWYLALIWTPAFLKELRAVDPLFRKDD